MPVYPIICLLAAFLWLIELIEFTDIEVSLVEEDKKDDVDNINDVLELIFEENIVNSDEFEDFDSDLEDVILFNECIVEEEFERDVALFEEYSDDVEDEWIEE